MDEETGLPEKQAEQATFVLTQAHDPSGKQENQINLLDYMRVVWRRRYLILVGTLLGAVTVLVLSLGKVDIYEAKATLILQPPQFSTELKPQPLSLETLKSILESDFIASELVNELMEKNLFEVDTEVAGVKGMLEVQIYPGKELDQPYMPLIDLIVRSDSPERSVVTANTWAEVFLIESAGLTWRGKQGALDFIEDQYPLVRDSLLDLESQLQEKQDHYDLQLNEIQRKRDLQTFTANTEIEELLREHEKMTEGLRLDFLNRWKLDLMKVEVKIQETQMIEFEEELLETEVAIQTQEDTLTHITDEIQSQPQYLVLSKAMTDEALWNRIGDVNGGLPEELNEMKLRSELLNPIYQELLSLLTTTRIDYDTLVPKREHLNNAVERLRKTIEEQNSLITRKDYELFALVKDRESEFTRLQREGEVQLEILKRGFDADFSRVERERDLVLEQLSREVYSVRVTYEAMAEQHQLATLAKSELEPDVKIGALAVRPSQPIGRNTRSNALAGLGAGFILSVMLAFALECVRLMLLPLSRERDLDEVTFPDSWE